MKKIFKILSISFIALLSFPLVSSFFYNSKKAQNEDQIPFPNFDKDFFTNFSKFIEQKFYFRPEIIDANKKLDNALLEAEQNIKYSQLSKIFGEDYLEPVEINRALYGRDDWLFYTGDNSVNYYRGNNLPTDEELETQATSLLNIKTACDKKGIKLAILACPNKEQIYSEFMPSYTINNNIKRLPIIRDYMLSKGLNYLYPYEELIEAKKEGEVYYKQDTHWNSRGAYFGYKKFMNSIGLDVSDVTFTAKEKTGGDLTDMCGFGTTYRDYDASYKTNVSERYIISGETVHSINEQSQNGKLYIISDSFRTALQPYAFKDFNEVFSTHRSNALSNESINFLEGLRSGDTILVQFVERYDSSVNEVAAKIIEHLEK